MEEDTMCVVFVGCIVKALKGSSSLKAHHGRHDTQVSGSQGMSYVHNRQFPGLDC